MCRLLPILRFVVLCCFFPILNAGAQAPTIAWQRSLGSPYADWGGQIMPTTDGGSIAVGMVGGNGGDVSGFHGLQDYWVVKQDGSGTTQWSTCLGGTYLDIGSVVRQTPDGGYLVGGEGGSQQGSGNVTSANSGGLDGWFVKLSSTGAIQWEVAHGGAQNEYVGDIKPTADGGYIVAGSTQAGPGQVPGNHGSYDMWLMKLNADGSMAWQKCIGGSQDDWGYGVTVAPDGYVIVGWTASTDGDAPGNNGSHDMFAAKVDLSGNMNWARTIGGSGYDEGYGVEAASDGTGYICAGLTRSNDGIVVGNHGTAGWQDAWVVKLNPEGEVDWQHCYGGSYNEAAYSITATADNGFVVAGSAQSLDGDVSCMPAQVPQIGNTAGWVFKIGYAGALLWNKVISGGYGDYEQYAKEAPDGSILVCGYTALSDVPGYHHDTTNTVGDIYVGKLAPGTLPTAMTLNLATPPANICSGSNITLSANFNGPSSGVTYHWYKNGVDQGVNAGTYSSSGFANGDSVYCTILVTGDGTCTVAQLLVSDTVALSVSAVAAPAIAIAATGSTTVCVGSALAFGSTVTGGSASGTYQWLVNGTPAGAGAGFSSTTFADGDVVSCDYADNTVCVVPGKIVSNSITVHVNADVNVTVSITADSGLTVCGGSALEFVASSSGGGNAPVFDWLVNGSPAAVGPGVLEGVGLTGGSWIATFSSNSLVNGDLVSCRFVSGAACALPDSVVSNVLAVTVKPVLRSSVSVGYEPAMICPGETVVFNAGASEAGAAPSYVWTVNGTPAGGDSAVFITSGLANGDIVRCTVSDAGQCVVASATTVTVTVNPAPVVGTVAPVLLPKGQSVTLMLPVSGPVTTYSWSPGVGLSDSSIADPVATPLQTTDYHLTVSSAAGCSDTGSLLVKIFSKVAIPGAFTPNGDGRNDIFYVVGGPVGSQIAEFAVYDRYGGAVFAVHGVAPDDPAYGWNGMVNGQPAPAGTYVYALRLRLADGSQQVFKGTVVLVR